jgi:aspartate/methionine/tyrosine aminotransferase
VSEPGAAQLVRILLERYETAVVPGQFFGAPQHVRLSFGGARETLAQGLRAIGAALDDLGTR